MADDVYRIEIPIQTVDQTEPALGQAQRRISRFEQSMQRSEQRLQRMNRTKWQMVLAVIDRASPIITNVAARAKSLVGGTYRLTLRVFDLATAPIRGLFNMLSSPLGMLGATGGMGAATIWPLQLAGNMEQAKIGFETMLGSAGKAITFLNKLKKFAADTPFEFPDLRDSAKRLLAFGFAADRIIPMMTSIGNAASGLGLGADGINRITIALGQIRAKSKVQAGEMLQLTEAGIPAWEFLAKAMGKSTAEVMKLSERGLIPADKAIQAILDGMDKKFPNMMEKQSRSLLGLFSTIKDVFSLNIVTAWGEGLRQAIQPRLVKIVDYFTKNEATTKAWEKALESAGRTAGNYVLGKVEEVQRAMSALASDNKFTNGDLWTKTSMAWDKIIEEPFERWWASGGQKFVADAAEKIGDGIGSMLGGFLASALGVAAQDADSKKNPFIQAGATAGEAFYKGFIVAFDTGKIAEKAKEAFFNLEKESTKLAPGGASPGILSFAGGALNMWIFSKLLGGAKSASGGWKWLKGLFGGGGAGPASSTAAAGGAATGGVAASRAIPGTGALKGLGQLAAYLGVLDLLSKGLEGGMDWTFGHKAGQYKVPSGIINQLNPLYSERYTDTRLPIWKRLGSGGTGATTVPSPAPVAVGKAPIVVTVQANSSPKYSITTAATPSEVLKIIRDNQNAIADELSDEIGANLALVFGNMPLGLGLSPAPAKP